MQNNTAFKVGLFVSLSAVALAGTILFFGEIPFFKGEKETYYVYFKNVAGLSKGSDVRVAGVKVGKVEDILFEDGKVKVVLRLERDVPIFRDAVAKIESLGLLGDKYVEIDPGRPESGKLPPGSVIAKTQTPTDISKMVETFQKTGENLNRLVTQITLLVESNRRDIERLIDNLNRLSVSLTKLIEENKENFRETLQNVSKITEELKKSVPRLVRSYEMLTRSLNTLVKETSPEIRETLQNVKEISATLREDLPKLVKNLEEITSAVAENRQKIETTIENLAYITENIRKGKGTLGKLINDPQLYKELKRSAKTLGDAAGVVAKTSLHVEAWGQYETIGESKAGLNVILKPSETHYYLLGIVGDSAGKVTKKTIYENGNPQTVVEKEYKPEFNVQYARIFRDPIFNRGTWVLRFGVKESTGGVGVDYVYSNRLMFFLDIWDFGREDRPQEKLKPNTEVGIKYFVRGPFFIRMGGYDLLNEKYRSVLLGGGMSFTDNDLKYLMGSVGIPGF